MNFPWPKIDAPAPLKDVIKIVGLILVLSVVAIGTGYLIDRFRPAEPANARLLEQHRAQVDAQLEAFDKRAAELQEQVERLDGEFYLLEAAVRQSIEQREEEHDAVDSALTIDDIDAVLKGGVRGASGRRPR